MGNNLTSEDASGATLPSTRPFFWRVTRAGFINIPASAAAIKAPRTIHHTDGIGGGEAAVEIGGGGTGGGLGDAATMISTLVPGGMREAPAGCWATTVSGVSFDGLVLDRPSTSPRSARIATAWSRVLPLRSGTCVVTWGGMVTGVVVVGAGFGAGTEVGLRECDSFRVVLALLTFTRAPMRAALGCGTSSILCGFRTAHADPASASMQRS